MKTHLQLAIAASLLTSGIVSAQMVNPNIHVIYGHNSGPPFIFTNYNTVTPVLNMTGPNQWQTNHNAVGDIVVVEDFDMMKLTWVWNGHERVYQATPQQIAYRKAAYALEIQAQKMAFYSNPFNVQKLDIVKTLYTPLTWGVVIGCFVFASVFKKRDAQWEDGLSHGLFLSFLSLSALVLLHLPENVISNNPKNLLLGVIALTLGFAVITTVKRRLSKGGNTDE